MYLLSNSLNRKLYIFVLVFCGSVVAATSIACSSPIIILSIRFTSGCVGVNLIPRRSILIILRAVFLFLAVPLDQLFERTGHFLCKALLYNATLLETYLETIKRFLHHVS